jgi:hypothetical protein
MVLDGNKYNSPFMPTSTNAEICVATRHFVHNTLVSPPIDKDAHIITFKKLWRNAKFVLAIQKLCRTLFKIREVDNIQSFTTNQNLIESLLECKQLN